MSGIEQTRGLNGLEAAKIAGIGGLCEHDGEKCRVDSEGNLRWANGNYPAISSLLTGRWEVLRVGPELPPEGGAAVTIEPIDKALGLCADFQVMMAQSGNGLSRACSEMAVAGWQDTLRALKAANERIAELTHTINVKIPAIEKALVLAGDENAAKAKRIAALEQAAQAAVAMGSVEP